MSGKGKRFEQLLERSFEQLPDSTIVKTNHLYAGSGPLAKRGSLLGSSVPKDSATLRGALQANTGVLRRRTRHRLSGILLRACTATKRRG